LCSCFFDKIENKCSEECASPLQKSFRGGICTCGIGKELINGICKECEEGKYSDSTTNFICTSCEGGKGPNEDRNGCTICGEGKYSNETTKYICASCVDGEEPSTDHTNCKRCEEGKYSNSSTNYVCICGMGYYGINSNGVCEPLNCEDRDPSSNQWKSCMNEGDDIICFEYENKCYSECPESSRQKDGSYSYEFLYLFILFYIFFFFFVLIFFIFF
jgi:hypothetical protein